MLRELNKDRCRALELLANHVRSPTRELSLDAIVNDISDEDLKWVTSKIHYFLLRLLEDVETETFEEESAILTD